MMQTFLFGIVGYLAASFIVPSFPFLYIVLRWRAQGRTEPGLGSIAALHYFRSVALLVALGALSSLVFDWISDRGLGDDAERTATGLLAGSALFVLLHQYLIFRTRAAAAPEVRRLFSGFVMVVGGIVLLGALLVLFVSIFQKEGPSRSEAIEHSLSWTLVWGATYLGTFVLLARNADAGA